MNGNSAVASNERENKLALCLNGSPLLFEAPFAPLRLVLLTLLVKTIPTAP